MAGAAEDRHRRQLLALSFRRQLRHLGAQRLRWLGQLDLSMRSPDNPRACVADLQPPDGRRRRTGAQHLDVTAGMVGLPISPEALIDFQVRTVRDYRGQVRSDQTSGGTVLQFQRRMAQRCGSADARQGWHNGCLRARGADVAQLAGRWVRVR